ncbi:HNH endonuclease family protein [Streptomyces sp. NPDC059255]|uniref:HNH endonuclease family protein n=1 Tax=Streptomyces sp. NPDC059255 TaxID=3346793 RepID=UPI0036C9C8AB
MRFRSAVAVLATVGVLFAPLSAAAAAPASRLLAAPGDVLAMPLNDALGALIVEEEDRTGYKRTLFRHWVDADRDGCDSRAEVLKQEAVVAPVQGAGCKLSGGRWYSAYDDKYVDGPSGLDIDHLVPLAEAWDSGASRWSPAERQEYANDLSVERSLIAVSARTNRSKADQDPATWMPPAEGYRCQYVADWIATKLRWQLTIDSAEKTALSEKATGCPNLPVRVALAR